MREEVKGRKGGIQNKKREKNAKQSFLKNQTMPNTSFEIPTLEEHTICWLTKVQK